MSASSSLLLNSVLAMAPVLRFGLHRKVEFAPMLGTDVADGSPTIGSGLEDPLAATAAALASPLDLPPVTQALTPDDRIVVALDAETPQAPQVAAGAIRALQGGAHDRRRITLVLSRAGEMLAPDPPWLAEPWGEEVEIVVHDPHDPDALCYLATSEQNEPIYLNRRVVEADFVLPIGPLRLASSFGYCGAWGTWFPAFADQATRQRYHAPAALQRAGAVQLGKGAAEAFWLLGVQFVVQVAPGPENRVLAVLAGSAAAVFERGQSLCEAAWRRPIKERASLVVVGISGGPEQQTWENVGRALFAAAQAVTEDGAIALCTELNRQPGPALRRLSGLGDRAARQRAVERQTTFDAQSAALLAELLERKQIYLLSGLEAETVENLGLAHADDEAEIVRLVHRHRSCLVLSDAQYALPYEVEV